MSLIECYEKLQNARPTAFTVSELLREKQLGGGVKLGLKANTNQHFYCGKTYIINRNLCFIGLEFGWCY